MAQCERLPMTLDRRKNGSDKDRPVKLMTITGNPHFYSTLRSEDKQVTSMPPVFLKDRFSPGNHEYRLSHGKAEYSWCNPAAFL